MSSDGSEVRGHGEPEPGPGPGPAQGWGLTSAPVIRTQQLEKFPPETLPTFKMLESTENPPLRSKVREAAAG